MIENKGYYTKEEDQIVLTYTISTAMQMISRTKSSIDKRIRRLNQDASEGQDLNVEEIKILELLAQGKERDEISDQFGIATITLQYRKRAIKKKLGAHNMIQSVAVAFRKGIIK